MDIMELPLIYQIVLSASRTPPRLDCSTRISEGKLLRAWKKRSSVLSIWLSSHSALVTSPSNLGHSGPHPGHSGLEADARTRTNPWCFHSRQVVYHHFLSNQELNLRLLNWSQWVWCRLCQRPKRDRMSRAVASYVYSLFVIHEAFCLKLMRSYE